MSATLGLLLHLSDMHLADPGSPGEAIGDYSKADVLSPADQQSRGQVIRHTLKGLGQALSAQGRHLDAIVVSGDVAVQGGRRGFELLTDVLENLGDVKPDNSQILVVPGNHDVAWYTEPGSAERYENFCLLRKEGYSTAWVEGVDIGVNSELLDDAGNRPPVVAAEDGSFIVVGINSSNHCGVRADESGMTPHLSHLETLAGQPDSTGAAIKSLLASWRRRGSYDIARVDAGQRTLLNQLITERLGSLREEGQDPVVIATLHHQLLPVGDSEELKPFEGITNVGELREWLASNEIDIVLHGHKHEERVIEDVFTPFEQSHAAGSVHRMLIVSAPTLGLGQSNKNPICRLLEFDKAMPRASGVKMTLIQGSGPGINVDLRSLEAKAEHKRIGDADPMKDGVIEGETVEDVYDALLSVQGSFDRLPSPLVCRIRNGASASKLPSHYPDVGFRMDDGEVDEKALQRWFEDTVDWWQAETRGTAAAFNHGERIRRRNPRGESQLDRLIASLTSSDSTSRAIALVVDPETDFQGEDAAFPAFTLVQMVIKEHKLNVTGYFRKQEMPHWWPINVAELARVQAEAVGRLRTTKAVEPGSITTVTVMPVAGPAAPRVVVPKIDRLVDTDAASLHTLLAPIFYPVGQSAEETTKQWRLIIDDWKPDEAMAADGDPVPVVGFNRLAAIAEGIHRQAGHLHDGHDDERERFVEYLQQLANANEQYSRRQQTEGNRNEGHREWRRQTDRCIEHLLQLIESICAPRQ